MDEDKLNMLEQLLIEWFRAMDAKYRGKKDRRWYANKIGKYLKEELKDRGNWKSGHRRRAKTRTKPEGLK